MAVQTRVFTSMSCHGSLVFECHMEYDDADYREINDDGDPADFKVVRWFGTNHHVKPLVVTTFKANGQVQWSRTVPAGDPFSVNAGGQVKYEGDIPQWHWVWGD